ncbi:SbtR family transcriptional regulator [Streptomyces sp. NPDC002514]|uniref:SbtR family transcriptional regulator n=1 Tax=unclassified Streptomyces TaxID=2593676 RepID=UPI003691C94C
MGPALVAWLGDLSEYATASRGLTAMLLGGPDADVLEQDDGCTAKITATADELLTRAQHVGAVRPGVHAEDLLALVSAVSLAAQGRDSGLAARLLEIVIGGIRMCGDTRHIQ